MFMSSVEWSDPITIDDIFLQRISNNNQYITTINIYAHPFFHNQKIQTLLSHLVANTVVTALKLKYTKLKHQNIQALAMVLMQNSTLRTLELSENDIDANTIQVLVNALEKSVLTTLNISDNNFDIDAIKAFVPVLTQTTTLSTLALSNAVRANCFPILFSALMQNGTLTSLSLGQNSFNATDITTLGQYLAQNSTLTALDLQYTDERMWQTLSTALTQKRQPPLCILSMSGNNINNNIQYVANVINNTKLRCLELRYCNIDAINIRELEPALAQNTTLTMLDLRNNEIQARGCQTLMRILHQNPAISSLGLDMDEYIDLCVSTLVQNTTLTSLNLLTRFHLDLVVFKFDRNTSLLNLNINERDFSLRLLWNRKFFTNMLHIAPLMGFLKANCDHSFVYSIFPLLPYIARLAATPCFNICEFQIINLDKFTQTLFCQHHLGNKNVK